jgi:hypothetical protein
LKLVRFFPALLAIPLYAQYGTRIGQIQTVYLRDIPVTSGPTLPFAGPAHIGELPAAAQPTSGAPAVTPKAEFETWAEQKAGNPSGRVSAPVVWIDVPGQGRYDLSFKPRADQGFERAGEVSEDSLMFSLGGNIFRLDCADRIAMGSATYNIYARKDSEAPANPTSFAFGAQR